MNTRDIRRLVRVGAALLAMVLLLAPAGAAQALLPETITLMLQAPPYRLLSAQDGSTTVEAEGYSATGEVGQALLPHRLVDVALPPDVAWDSLALVVHDVRVAVVPGTFKLRAAELDQPGAGLETPAPVDARSEATPLARIAAAGQMRKWRFARVDFCPFQYDEATGQLRVVDLATVELRFQRTGKASSAALLSDTALDREAAARFANYAEARSWYPHADRAGSITYDYVIVTTNAIAAGSGELANFVAHKQAWGHSVRVVTEDDYDSLTGQAPDGRAEKVRQWLKDNYAAYGIKHVLLIGNPTPDGAGSTDLPMKMCWPRRHEADYRESPTDYFFADLTGNWDLNGNGYYGEWVGDMGIGGVDLVPEVYVGRIPFYGSYADLDAILRKTMTYASATDTDWRKSILLPMSFSKAGYDGAPLAQQMWDDYLQGAGYDPWRQYQQGSGPCGPNSAYPGEEELRGDAVVDRWQTNAYGIVSWWGHGSITSAAVGYEGCWDGTLFGSWQTSSLDDARPAFVYQCSCSNGYPEVSGNLGYALLKRGAVVTVSASRVSWFNAGVGYGQFDGNSTNSGIGYEVVRRWAAGDAAGKALYDAKSDLPMEYDTRLMNFYDFNLYGDPGLSLKNNLNPPVSSARVPYYRYTIEPAIPVSWRGYSPDGVGIETYTIQVRDDAAGTWMDWLVDTTAISDTYAGQVGHTYRFRSIATDLRNVVETDVPADGDALVTVAAARLPGQVSGNRGEPAFPVQVTADPPAINGTVSPDGWGAYELFFDAAGSYTLTVDAAMLTDVFGALAPMKGISVSGDAAASILVVPPAEEAIANGQFEIGLLGWNDAAPFALASPGHTGDGSARLGSPGGPMSLTPVLWQTTTIPAQWQQPTLSLMVRVTGTVGAEDLQVLVVGETQTVTVALSPTAGVWTHVWQDLSALSGETVAVGFRVQTSAAFALWVDEVSLGPGSPGPRHVFLPLALRDARSSP